MLDELTSLQKLNVLSAGLEGLAGFSDAQNLATQYKATSISAGNLDTDADSIVAFAKLRGEKIGDAGKRYAERQKSLYYKAGVTLSGSAGDAYAQSLKNSSENVFYNQLDAIMKANDLRAKAGQIRVSAQMAAGRARTQSWFSLGKGLLDMGTQVAKYSVSEDKAKPTLSMPAPFLSPQKLTMGRES